MGVHYLPLLQQLVSFKPSPTKSNAMIDFSSPLDQDEFNRMTVNLVLLDEFSAPDELIEAGYTVHQTVELTGQDGRKWFCTAYVRHQHRVVMANATESASSDLLSGEVLVFASANWAALTQHWQ